MVANEMNSSEMNSCANLNGDHMCSVLQGRYPLVPQGLGPAVQHSLVVSAKFSQPTMD